MEDTDPGSFLSDLQAAFPEAAIVGAVCDGGHVRLDAPDTHRSQPEGRRNNRDGSFPPPISRVDHGIFGLALGGDVPVHSVVSRGMRSLTTGGTGSESSDWEVSETSELEVGSDDDVSPTHHLIRTVRNISTGETINAASWLYMKMSQSLPLCYVPQIGLRRGRERGGCIGAGFEILGANPWNDGEGERGLLISAGSFDCRGGVGTHDSPVGSEIDLFSLEGAACLEDCEHTLHRLHDRVESRGERVMGAVMYSCNGRGPRAGSIIEEDMADADRFSREFPTVACLGFYAGGEIGPRATVGGSGVEGVLRRGVVELQGFTVVFVIFIVPSCETSIQCIDDSPESVMQHMRKKRTAKWM